MRQHVGYVPGAWEGPKLPKHNCPACGKRMKRMTKSGFCSKTCRDEAEGNSEASERELNKLMAQYREQRGDP